MTSKSAPEREVSGVEVSGNHTLFRFLGRKASDENTPLFGSSFAISEPHKLNFQDLEECVSFLHVKTLSKTSAEILIALMVGRCLFEVLEFSKM